MSRLSRPSLRFGRVLLSYPIAVFSASVAMAILGFFMSLKSISSLSDALSAFFTFLLFFLIVIAILALPGFVLALLLVARLRFRSWASFACLGGLNGALGLALVNAIPGTGGECLRRGPLCPPDFSSQFLFWFMLAGMLAGLVFRRVAIGSRS